VDVGPVEALEDVGQVLGRDALALVGHGDDHVAAAAAVLDDQPAPRAIAARSACPAVAVGAPREDS
jgi:hypothetical protein